jgi:hypothetical protein
MFNKPAIPSQSFVAETLLWLDSGDVVDRLEASESFVSDRRLHQLMDEIGALPIRERLELASQLTQLQRRNLSLFAWRIQSGIAGEHVDRQVAATALDLATYQARAVQDQMRASAIHALQSLPRGIRDDLEWLRMAHLDQLQASDPLARRQQYDQLMLTHGDRILGFVLATARLPKPQRSIVILGLQAQHSSGMLRGMYLRLIDAAVASRGKTTFYNAMLTFILSLLSASDRRDVLTDVPLMRDAGERIGIDFDAAFKALEVEWS